MITSLRVGAIFQIQDQASQTVQRLSIAMRELAGYTATVRTEMAALSAVRIGSITARMDALVASMGKGATAATTMTTAVTGGAAQMDAGLSAALVTARALTAQLTAAGRAGALAGRGGVPQIPGPGGGQGGRGPGGGIHWGRVGVHAGPAHASVGGNQALATGAGIWGVGHIMHEAMDPLHQESQLRSLGLSESQIKDVTAKARATASAVPGSGYAQNIKTIGELYSVVGLPHALELSEKFATLDRVMALSGKGKEEGSGYILSRAGELMGKLSDPNDLHAFEATLNQMARVSIATHGKVTPQEWLNFVKQAGPAAGTLTEEGLYTSASIIQAMGGHRAGTAAQALQRQFAGGKMTKPVAEELTRIGIFKEGDYEVGRGGHLTFKTNAAKSFVDKLQHDPLSAIVGDLVPALSGVGYTSLEDQSREIYKIIGTGPAQREVYEILRGHKQISAERGRMAGALGPEAALANSAANDPVQGMKAFTKSFNDLLGALGSPALQASMPAMHALTTLFNSMASLASNHKREAAVVGGAALGATGGAALGFGIGLLGGPIGALGGAVIGGTLGAAIAYMGLPREHMTAYDRRKKRLGITEESSIWPAILPTGTASAATAGAPNVTKVDVGGITVKAETDDPRGLAEKILGEINRMITAGHLHNQGTADSAESSPFATGAPLP